jgi:hypothetical protein
LQQRDAADEAKKDALSQRDRAVKAEEAANNAKSEAQTNAARAKANADRAEEQRDRALLSESKALSALADLKGKNGDMTSAALLALEGLPSRGGADRPYTSEPEAALYSAIYEISPEPPDWCVEKAKWPFDTPEWKTWLSNRERDPTAPSPPQKQIL